MVKIYGFPRIQDDRTRFAAQIGVELAQGLMEPACNFVEPPAVAAVYPRGYLLFADLKLQFTAQMQLSAA